MVLQDQDIDWYAEQFSQGAGRFSSRPDSPVNTAG
jgi:hypothetical protein